MVSFELPRIAFAPARIMLEYGGIDFIIHSSFVVIHPGYNAAGLPVPLS